MAIGIGVGLPFGVMRSPTPLPPQPQALWAFLEADGRVDTSGEVSSWVSATPGALTVTGAGGERPNISGEITSFNGSSDRLTFPGNAMGAVTKATFGAWVKVGATISVNDTLLYTSDLSGGYFGLATFNNARWIGAASGATAGNMNGSADGTVRPAKTAWTSGVWQFVCIVFDGTQASQNDRLKIYLLEHGQDVPELQGQVAGGTIPASITVGGGTGAIGDLVGFSRQLPFDTTAAYLYREAALTTTDVVSLARRKNPLAGKKSVLALGDSITLGVGDNNVDTTTTSLGGYRGRLLELAGDDEAWWFVGPTQSGVIDNNRCSAVGGSKVDAHLAQWNDAIAAGWRPQIVLYMGGRNDLSAPDSQATIDARWVALFNAISAYPTVEHIIVSTIVPESTNGAATTTANASLASICAGYPKITLVDGYAALDYATDLADAVHPNSSGYWKLAQVYYDALAPLLSLSTTWRNPTRLSTLRGWWVADRGLTVSGSDIVTLLDERGQGRTLSKTNDGALTAAPQRVASGGKGGKTIARWNGSATGLRGAWLAADWAAGWSGTIAIAAKITSGTSGVLIDNSQTTTTNQGAAVFRESGTLKARRIATDASVGSDTSTAWRVITATLTPAGAALRIDGVEVGTSATGVSMVDLANLQLGALFGGIYPLTGDIGEAVVCGSVLSGSDLTNLESYLTERWI